VLADELARCGQVFVLVDAGEADTVAFVTLLLLLVVVVVIVVIVVLGFHTVLVRGLCAMKIKVTFLKIVFLILYNHAFIKNSPI
jgi:hypothetical protein